MGKFHSCFTAREIKVQGDELASQIVVQLLPSIYEEAYNMI